MPEDNTNLNTSIPPVDPSMATPADPMAGDSTTPVDPTMPVDPAASVDPAMPADSAMPTSVPTVADAAASTIVEPTLPGTGPAPEVANIYAEVAGKISEAHNVLIALSSDPSVDEMAAAIGLSLYLDKLGKRATAIYSGSTPNALEFLNPEETFEPSADTLQDFVIALNKEKADHLRYKLDGDYVKIYITPYKARLSDEDLEFSYGDYNVDLVLSLDVANGIDLDSALREHGRIMHDAVIINITTGNPGKFGEIEWSDKRASSISEMIARLLYSVKSKVEVGKEEATAFLTGIVAATDHFSNATTTPETMQMASRLMRSGANQQLVSKNIALDLENEMFTLSASENKKGPSDPTKLDIEHEGEEGVDETKEITATVTEKDSSLLDDLKAAEASLSQAGAETTPEEERAALKIDGENDTDDLKEASEELAEAEEAAKLKPEEEPQTESSEEAKAEEKEPEPSEDSKEEKKEEASPEPESGIEVPEDEKVVAPNIEFGSTAPDIEDEGKYGKMLEDALESVEGSNPAASAAPEVASAPEVNGVPEMNYNMPMPGDEILPPPPAPPIDMSEPLPSTDAAPAAPVTPIEPATPPEEPTPEPLGSQPAMQDQVYAPQVSDPSAFKIPGM